VHWVQIRDQNRLLSKSPYGRPAQEESWQAYHWMRDSQDAKVHWLWDRMRVSTRPDPSDAGMAYFLATGDEDCDPAKLKALLDDRRVATPLAVRKQIRLEAENFRELVGFEVEDTNDRSASQRLQVKLAKGESGRIATRFEEPYAAAGKYDVLIRCSCPAQMIGRLTLSVDGTQQSTTWETNNAAAGWFTHTIRGVNVHLGSQIAIAASGGGLRIDYVQLDQ
jgi:hypothetical protein